MYKTSITLFILINTILLLSSCSGRAYHQGFKMMQKQQCYQLEGELQAECLESLEYSIDGYEEEREQLKQND